MAQVALETDPAFSGTLPFSRAPDGELTFEDGEATVADDVDVDWLVTRYPNLVPAGDAPAAADDSADEADGDGEPDADDDAEPPLDPDDHTVPELRDALDDGDFSAADLEAIREAEAAGDDRDTALEAIDAALEDN